MKVFGELEKQLIQLCHQCPPDLEAIKAKIAEGADVNSYDGAEDVKSSLLSEVLYGFGWIDDGEKIEQFGCQYLPEVVSIILDAGFDVSLDEGRYGAHALAWLIFCATDKYIIDAGKLLLDAGADPSIIPCPDDPHETVIETIRFEGFFQESAGDDGKPVLDALADLLEGRIASA